MAKKQAAKKTTRKAAAESVGDLAGESKVWPLGKIVMYDRNPRTHPPAQIELLAKLLTRYGPDQPIVVDENGVILKGHGRLMAARMAGLKAFPVLQRRGLSEDDKISLRIGDNQSALLSGWDNELLRFEITELQASETFDLSLLGFGEVDLSKLLEPVAPPMDFKSFDEDIDVQYRCPSCGFAWSGNPTPGVADAMEKGEEAAAAANGKKRRKPKQPEADAA